MFAKCSKIWRPRNSRKFKPSKINALKVCSTAFKAMFVKRFRVFDLIKFFRLKSLSNDALEIGAQRHNSDGDHLAPEF